MLSVNGIQCHSCCACLPSSPTHARALLSKHSAQMIIAEAACAQAVLNLELLSKSRASSFD